MKYNPQAYPFPSRRTLVYGRRGMAATGNPLATLAGMTILQNGGNAVDAALAMATSLTVVEPVSNGLGGDAFAIIHDGKKIYGLNASGPSPQALCLEDLRARGFDAMPQYGWEPINVPGAVGGWISLWRRWGSLSLEEIMAPAIDYAKNGYVLQPNVARNWALEFEARKSCQGDDKFAAFYELFSKDGQPYEAGDVWKSEAMAKTLESICESQGEAFYRGDLAGKIVEASEGAGGYLSLSDLSNYVTEWVDPISVSYRGHEIWEIPPNGHGLAVLLALNILKEDAFAKKEDPEEVHKQIEAMKLSFADCMEYIADPRYMKLTVEDLLQDAYGRARREEIGDRAILPKPGKPTAHGTVYMAAADQSGLMISMIQSNYTGFGSGIVVPETGIALHNRGCNFSFEEGHVNCVQGGKKSYHTIIPGFITKDDKPLGPFGIMGAFMQPQAHVQVAMNLLDYGLNPQAALDAWRWQWVGEKKVEVEPDFPEDLAAALQDKGHDISYVQSRNDMGRGQIILRQENGVFVGGTEGRTDGCVLGY